MNFLDYFDEEEEYPSPSESMLPLGMCYHFISTTFLNGWINYVKIISAQLISRYQDYQMNLMNLSKTESLSKTTAFDLDIGKYFGDDVLILAKTKNPHIIVKSCILCGNPDSVENKEGYTWWFFRYDKDCSDASIGRFETEDTDEAVIYSFKEFANELSYDKESRYGSKNSGHPAIELPLKIFKGWISG